MDRTHVSLAIFDFGNDLSVVTELMGITPTKAWLAGESLPNHATAKRNHSRWALESGLDETADVGDQLQVLVTVLEGRREGLREAARRYSIELQCAIYYENETPGIHLSEDLVRRVAALALAIDFDLYFTGKREGSQ